ncbi:protein kinase [Nocardioides sp. zg-579]|uniref:non-specific serine/threonine protein kinase n=1 Tax=Nocardioides marmotae TaxID=2663857 RepID=A0A6I3JFT3_9ACTN|nr:protein kinase [Gordonia jinghuaiqii]MTB97176.1 protein kinase [Nocardioides marmotae]
MASRSVEWAISPRHSRSSRRFGSRDTMGLSSRWVPAHQPAAWTTRSPTGLRTGPRYAGSVCTRGERRGGPGRVIAGRYSLEREIGRGGMGAVWLGRDEVLGRAVALKRIGLAPGGDGADLERAQREARLAARLNHPHVVAVFDLVDEDGERWLVMEHVAGTTLAELVRIRGPLDPDTAADLIGQAADALAAAHAAGVVHRDVKPSNMLVTPDERVKISDFGIARAEADASLTRTGLVTGSPAYLAPEVASGRLATPPSDVWSLGASLFHALAGRPPYDVGENLLGALYRIVHEDPPRLDDAGWLRPLLAATMTREPGDRWSMAQVRDFLQAGPDAAAHRPVPVARASHHDELGTQLLARADRGPTPPPPPPSEATVRTSAPPAAGGPPAPGPGHAAPRRRLGRLVPVLLGLAAVVLLSVGGYLLGRGGGDDAGREAGAATTSPPASATGEPSPPARPTEAGIEAFVRDYLTTAAADPSAGFAMLTPEFQEASGGLPGYAGFWGDVDSVEVERVEADPSGPSVRYRYTYTLSNGRSIRDDVKLELAFEDGRYAIAGEG